MKDNTQKVRERKKQIDESVTLPEFVCELLDLHVGKGNMEECNKHMTLLHLEIKYIWYST